jgi:kinesin family protein 11
MVKECSQHILGSASCRLVLPNVCRALSEREIADRAPQVITCNEALREVTLFQTGGKSLSRTFRFDKVFGPDSTQEKLFKQAIVPIVGEVMDGFNCTIFAYGQTGTGKTYTMEGGPRESDDGRKLSAQAGVIPRAIKQIFDTIEANNSDSTVKVSFLELYNEELTDLMSFDSADDTKKLRYGKWGSTCS